MEQFELSLVRWKISCCLWPLLPPWERHKACWAYLDLGDSTFFIWMCSYAMLPKGPKKLLHFMGAQNRSLSNLKAQIEQRVRNNAISLDTSFGIGRFIFFCPWSKRPRFWSGTELWKLFSWLPNLSIMVSWDFLASKIMWANPAYIPPFVFTTVMCQTMMWQSVVDCRNSGGSIRL